ncbi:MAG: alpha-1,2-fucosyltransferase [Candidatus Puniceispirillum sp.]|nr:alpha-1,2-fucosyltransferase [Candidatus Puniceispirillum sp.]
MVEIYGGFGNQIYQLLKANELSNLGFKVYVNTRDFKRVAKENADHLTARKLVLPVNFFNLEEVGSQKFLKYRIRRILRDLKILNKITLNDKFFTLLNDKNIEGTGLKKNNYFIGHWQSFNNLENCYEYLSKSLSNHPLLKNSLSSHKKSNSTMIHVRRGDYLKFNEELPIFYYEKSIELIKTKTKTTNFKIYTDDINWCKNQKLFTIADEILTSSDSPDDTIKTFSSMLNHQNYIIANSTFSLITAFLGSSEDSLVTYPHPWFKERNYNKNIVSPNWEKIKYI